MAVIDGEEVYLLYRDKVRGYISQHVNQREEVEDLCADVFEKVVSSLDTYDSTKASVSTWIFTITRNRVIDFYRRNREHAELPEELASTEMLDAGLLREETLRELAEALMKLSEEKRTIIILRYYNGLSLKDISEKTGISYGMVKVKHQQALKELKKIMKI